MSVQRRLLCVVEKLQSEEVSENYLIFLEKKPNPNSSSLKFHEFNENVYQHLIYLGGDYYF